MSATSLRLAARINGHVQPTCAVKVDTLLTEEKARAKLINEAKLKFGIIDDNYRCFRRPPMPRHAV